MADVTPSSFDDPVALAQTAAAFRRANERWIEKRGHVEEEEGEVA